MRVLVAFVALSGVVGPVAANPVGGTEPSAAQQTSGQPTGSAERPVCRTVRDNSASRIGARRVCRTPSEWREATEQAQRNGGLQD